MRLPLQQRRRLSLQGLHSVAYHGGLARPLIAPPGAASRLTGDDLAQFVSEHFTGASMALAGGAHLLVDSNGESSCKKRMPLYVERTQRDRGARRLSAARAAVVL